MVFASGSNTRPLCSKLVLILFELVTLTLVRQIAFLFQPAPLVFLAAHETIDEAELARLPTAVADLGLVAIATLPCADDLSQTAAFGACLAVFTAWHTASSLHQGEA